MSEIDFTKWCKTLQVLPSSGLDQCDKVILPASILEELLEITQHSLPSPLLFKVSKEVEEGERERTDHFLHVGVKEFSSEEGLALLPSWVLEALVSGPSSSPEEDGILLTFTVATLPKGNWAKLTSLDNDLEAVKDVRSMFEASLRSNFTALTTGQPLWAHYGGKRLRFKVEELRPSSAIDIIDTDLEIDIVTTTANQLETTSLSSTIIKPKRRNTLQVSLPFKGTIPAKESQYFEFLWERNSNICIQVKCQQEVGPNLFLLPGIKEPSEEVHYWANYGSSKDKTILVDSNDSLFQSPYHYSLAISSAYNCDYEILVSEPSSTSEATSEPIPTEEEVRCETCHKNISKDKINLHQAFCSRNNAVCDKCSKVFLKKDFDSHWHCGICSYGGIPSDNRDHYDFYHFVVVCECKAEFKGKHDLSKHKVKDCPRRLIECRYCHNMVHYGKLSEKPQDRLRNLTEHEGYCGDRTIQCAICSSHVTLKEMSVHAQYHEYTRQRQPLPFSKCYNHGCTRPQPSDSNVLSLCQPCFSPFWSSNLDPGNRMLLSRMARKYHQQLTVGCQNSWCFNPHCATYRGQPLDATSAALELVPLLKVPSSPVYFCLDQPSVTRWQYVTELRSRIGESSYLVEWCIKALDTTEDDVTAAVTWLRRHAPTLTKS